MKTRKSSVAARFPLELNKAEDQALRRLTAHYGERSKVGTIRRLILEADTKINKKRAI